jgi:hypothetical protein
MTEQEMTHNIGLICLILARIVVNFNMELAPEGRSLTNDQDVYSFVNNPALNLYWYAARNID